MAYTGCVEGRSNGGQYGPVNPRESRVDLTDGDDRAVV